MDPNYKEYSCVAECCPPDTCSCNLQQVVCEVRKSLFLASYIRFDVYTCTKNILCLLFAFAIESSILFGKNCQTCHSRCVIRGVHMAKGSQLLPPAFSSTLDDTASSSLDVPFDPSDGLICLLGITQGKILSILLIGFSVFYSV